MTKTAWEHAGEVHYEAERLRPSRHPHMITDDQAWEAIRRFVAERKHYLDERTLPFSLIELLDHPRSGP